MTSSPDSVSVRKDKSQFENAEHLYSTPRVVCFYDQLAIVIVVIIEEQIPSGLFLGANILMTTTRFVKFLRPLSFIAGPKGDGQKDCLKNCLTFSQLVKR